MDNVCLCEAPRIRAKFKRTWECTICGKPEQPATPSPSAVSAPSPAGISIDPRKITPADVVAWAVDRWNEQVKNRPLVNVHRRSLDDAWRRVMRDFGGDPDGLVGPSHDELHAACVPSPKGDEHIDAATPEPALAGGMRVTTAMVNAAWNEAKTRRMTGLPTDFRAVLEAALAANSPASGGRGSWVIL